MECLVLRERERARETRSDRDLLFSSLDLVVAFGYKECVYLSIVGPENRKNREPNRIQEKFTPGNRTEPNRETKRTEKTNRFSPVLIIGSVQCFFCSPLIPPNEEKQSK